MQLTGYGSLKNQAYAVFTCIEREMFVNKVIVNIWRSFDHGTWNIPNWTGNTEY